MSRLTIQERLDLAFEVGKKAGSTEERMRIAKELKEEKILADSGILRAASELAQANAKLTYAMSRMISKEGW